MHRKGFLSENCAHVDRSQAPKTPDPTIPTMQLDSVFH